MPLRLLTLLALFAMFMPMLRPITAHADEERPLPPDWELLTLGGHYYTQTSNAEGAGFVVSNQDTPAMYDFYKKYGPKVLGYPISQRFEMNDRTTQVFQRGALQVDPIEDKVVVMNLMDMMHVEGLDTWLESTYGIPKQWPEWAMPEFDSLDQLIASRLKLIDEDPKISAFYYSQNDPLALFGLPTSRVEEIGAARSMRFQRGVIQLWTEDVAWAKAGQVTTVMAGSIAADAGMFPSGRQFSAVPAPEAPPARPFFTEDELMDPTTAEIPTYGERWIDVDISKQRIYAMVDDYPVFWAPVTTGKTGTPVGQWHIFSRVFNETMDSRTLGIPLDAGGWVLPNVYYTQYFIGGGFAIHSNYWAPDYVFGRQPSTAGCVGMRVPYAEYFWRFAGVGTLVNVHY